MRTKGPRADKVESVGELKQLFDTATGAILTEYRGMTVSEISTLRGRLRASGGEYHVVKNTLFKRAAGEKITPEFEALLAGPTAIAFAKDDIVAATKAVLDYFRELRKPAIVVKGGYVDGAIYSPEQMTALSKIPPRPVVLSQALGTLQAPLTNFAGTLQNVLGEFARTLQGLSEKRQTEAG